MIGTWLDNRTEVLLHRGQLAVRADDTGCDYAPY
jgi:hypothetical protein